MFQVCHNVWKLEGKFVDNTSTNAHARFWKGVVFVLHTLFHTIVCIGKMCIEIVILSHDFQVYNCDFKSQF